MSCKIENTAECRIDDKAYPAVGFGTYPFKGQECKQAVQHAIKAGYRIIDTATFYENFEPIAQALKNQKRSDFYLISKIWPSAQQGDKVRKDLQRTLEQLEMDYIDAYLIHWPHSKTPIEHTLGIMHQLQQEKKVRHLGLSNVTVNHLKRVFELNLPILWVQVEMHPFFYDPCLLSFCQQNALAVQAWAPLARGSVHQDPLLSTIGKKYGKSASQVAIRWILQHGVLPLPSSTNPRHIEENKDISHFALSQEDMLAIDHRAKNGERTRIENPDALGFSDEFDFSYEECWPLSIK